jgi:transcriptional regulator with XRE-family HTH domain
MDKFHIGYKIQLARKKKKISQFDFAEKIGLSRTSMSNIENGKNGVSVEKIRVICETLEVDPNYLFDYNSGFNAIVDQKKIDRIEKVKREILEKAKLLQKLNKELNI